MIVITGLQTRRLQLLGRVIQCLRHLHPSTDTLGLAGAGEDDVLRAENVVQLDGVRHAFRGERFWSIVRRVALDSNVVHHSFHRFGIVWSPVVVRSKELDTLVAHFGHRPDRGDAIVL